MGRETTEGERVGRETIEGEDTNFSIPANLSSLSISVGFYCVVFNN